MNETETLEHLNQATSVRGFFIATVDVFHHSIDALIQRIFLKDDFAVQSVVGPLLHDSGPLGDLSVRLKLLFGLGVLPANTYHDIDTIIKLRNHLNSDGTEYVFTDSTILKQIQSLHLIKQMNIPQLSKTETKTEGYDPEFYQFQLARQQQIIRSSLSLAIVGICNELAKESPF